MPPSDWQIVSPAEVEDLRDIILGANIVVLDPQSGNQSTPIEAVPSSQAVAIRSVFGVSIVGIEVETSAESALEGCLHGVIVTIPFAQFYEATRRERNREGQVRRDGHISGHDGGRGVGGGFNIQIMRLVSDVTEGECLVGRELVLEREVIGFRVGWLKVGVISGNAQSAG